MIAIVFGVLWARDATAELRGEPIVVEPERREMKEAGEGHDCAAGRPAGRRASGRRPGTVTRSRFLEGATLGLGGVIGGLITVPVAGFALLPSFLGQKQHKVDLGPISNFELNQWYITTFVSDPAEGAVSRRTAFIRNNGRRTTRQAERAGAELLDHLEPLRAPRLPGAGERPDGRSTSARRSSTRHTANGPVDDRSGDLRPATAARATAASTTPRATASPARPCARSTATTSRSTTAA